MFRVTCSQITGFRVTRSQMTGHRVIWLHIPKTEVALFSPPSGTRKTDPWLWIPTLYFAEGIPYFIVNVISVIMFKNLGMNNADVALYTCLLYLPWVIKPLWSPFVDIIRTKRWWILLTQTVAALSFALVALTIPGEISSSGAFIPALVIC